MKTGKTYPKNQGSGKVYTKGHKLHPNKQHETAGEEHKFPGVMIPDEVLKGCG